MFIVHNELEDGWMWVTNVRTEEQGLIVEDLVEDVVSTALWYIMYITFNRRCLSSCPRKPSRMTKLIVASANSA